VFERVLVANRGEIACRVMRTARAMGLRTVAVFSDTDREAAHVQSADEAYRIGPAPARESYLNSRAILEVAQRARAQCIHPGYGFLSENAAFAEACATTGIVFIGPPPRAIQAMGSKSEAKSIMQAAGVPLIPGYHGEDQGADFLQRQASQIGFPVLIKASAGGGGKGMRRVDTPTDFADALASARREAAASFADERMLVERYVLRPRHVEVQVFADTRGQAVHLFERDCSVQRRHQKVIEEAPAPGLDPALRREMGQAAVAAAQAIGYVGAGTVEFILDEDGRFYFMEMNTRLQVEHPVTEYISGQDLVQWQLQVAAGEALPCTQAELSIDGHAIEARLYAEDPDRNFQPATGTLARLRFPRPCTHVRVDTGVREGDVVSVHYDPMLAKIITWDRDRSSALMRLRTALQETEISGVTTNLAFLGKVLDQQSFREGTVDTGFVDAHREALLPGGPVLDDSILAIAALYVLSRRAQEARAAASACADPGSPWHQTDGWRLNEDNFHKIWFHHDRDEHRDDHQVTAHYRADAYLLELGDAEMFASATLTHDGSLIAHLDDHRQRATVVERGDLLEIRINGAVYELVCYDPATAGAKSDARPGSLNAPMPGKVIQVLAKAGQGVAAGTPLVVLEAMKMEHTICAPADGTVVRVNFEEGALVEEGVELLILETKEEMT
jgi:3-methylcrotonyl-CoA carboxylase alpha subunit